MAALRDLLSRFARDRRGIAAVEFVVIVPVMLLLYVGASDLALAITANRKLQTTANATADLVAQDSTTNKAEIAGALGIARALMQPLDAAKVRIVLSSILIDDKGKATVDWSSAVNGATARRKGTEFILPPSLTKQPSRSFIVVEASYAYTPLGGFGFNQVLDMSKSAYFAPRNTTGSAGVECSDCS